MLIVLALWTLFSASAAAGPCDSATQPASRPDTQPASQPAASQPGTVYQSRFKETIGPEWSHRNISTTPNGKRTFLGTFKNEPLRFSLSHLSPHQFVEVRFDLLIINHWDGSYYGVGPQIWQLKMTGGPVLLSTTFSTCELSGDSFQAFPDNYPDHLYPPFTGASEKKTLGYSFDVHGKYRNVKMDSVYALRFVVPHTQPDLKLEFGFVFKGGLGEAVWGVDNFAVAVRDAPAALAPEEMERLWKKLSGRNPVQALAAKWAFLAAGQPVAGFLKKKLEALEPDRARVRRILADLESDNADERLAAEKQLKGLDPDTLPILMAAMNQTRSPEVQLRLAPVIAMLKSLNSFKTGQDSVPVSARIEHILKVLGEWQDWEPKE